MCAGIKDIENRSWETSHHGKLLIHASSYWGADLFDEMLPLPVMQDYSRMFDEMGEQVGSSTIIGTESVDSDVTRLVLLDEAHRREFELLKTELISSR